MTTHRSNESWRSFRSQRGTWEQSEIMSAQFDDLPGGEPAPSALGPATDAPASVIMKRGSLPPATFVPARKRWPRSRNVTYPCKTSHRRLLLSTPRSTKCSSGNANSQGSICRSPGKGRLSAMRQAPLRPHWANAFVAEFSYNTSYNRRYCPLNRPRCLHGEKTQENLTNHKYPHRGKSFYPFVHGLSSILLE